MKTLKVLTLLLLVAVFGASCASNHYAKAKRKVTMEQKQPAPIAEYR